MEIVSINVGLPRTVSWRGRAVSTAIFKAPVAGEVTLGNLNFVGDQQADPSVHGGPDKAVYSYAAEHYAAWQAELPEVAWGWGMFGENLTTSGLDEAQVRVGDRFQVGSAVLVAVQPRQPCYKLAVRFERPDMPKRFLASGRSGIYFRVERVGSVRAGDQIDLIERDPNAVRVSDITMLYLADEPDPALLRRALASPALPVGWRDYFADRLAAA